MKLRAEPLAFVALAAACGARTQLAGSSGSAVAGDAGLDAPRVCDPVPEPAPPFECTPEADQKCEAWAQSLVTGGYAHSTCMLGQQISKCLLGYQNCTIIGSSPFCACGAGGSSCSGGEVCVSDTLGGSASCRPVCVPYCDISDPTKCSAPGERCWCSTGPCFGNDVCTYGASGEGPWSCQPKCLTGP